MWASSTKRHLIDTLQPGAHGAPGVPGVPGAPGVPGITMGIPMDEYTRAYPWVCLGISMYNVENYNLNGGRGPHDNPYNIRDVCPAH